MSLRYVGILSRDGGEKADELLEAPCDDRIVDRRDSPDTIPGRPRAFLAMMTSSKNLMDAVVPGLVSRSWMNSLKAVDVNSVSPVC